jgi:hypothetical protein
MYNNMALYLYLRPGTKINKHQLENKPTMYDPVTLLIYNGHSLVMFPHFSPVCSHTQYLTNHQSSSIKASTGNEGFYVLPAVVMKSTILWDTTPCIPGFLLRLLFDPKDGGDMFL